MRRRSRGRRIGGGICWGVVVSPTTGNSLRTFHDIDPALRAMFNTRMSQTTSNPQSANCAGMSRSHLIRAAAFDRRSMYRSNLDDLEMGARVPAVLLQSEHGRLVSSMRLVCVCVCHGERDGDKGVGKTLTMIMIYSAGVWR